MSDIADELAGHHTVDTERRDRIGGAVVALGDRRDLHTRHLLDDQARLRREDLAVDVPGIGAEQPDERDVEQREQRHASSLVD